MEENRICDHVVGTIFYIDYLGSHSIPITKSEYENRKYLLQIEDKTLNKYRFCPRCGIKLRGVFAEENAKKEVSHNLVAKKSKFKAFAWGVRN